MIPLASDDDGDDDELDSFKIDNRPIYPPPNAEPSQVLASPHPLYTGYLLSLSPNRGVSSRYDLGDDEDRDSSEERRTWDDEAEGDGDGGARERGDKGDGGARAGPEQLTGVTMTAGGRGNSGESFSISEMDLNMAIPGVSSGWLAAAPPYGRNAARLSLAEGSSGDYLVVLLMFAFLAVVVAVELVHMLPSTAAWKFARYRTRQVIVMFGGEGAIRLQEDEKSGVCGPLSIRASEWPIVDEHGSEKEGGDEGPAAGIEPLV